MVFQAERRDSRGWVDVGWVVVGDVVWWERRRVSGRPGAEGAPRVMGSVAVVLVLEVLVLVVAWEGWGVMRRDCDCGGFGQYGSLASG